MAEFVSEEEQGDCFYRINGAAHGAAQIHVGSVDTVKECVDLVKEKDENAEAAMVGNAWGASGQMPCYSERKFQGASANNYYMICYFPRTPKQPGNITNLRAKKLRLIVRMVCGLPAKSGAFDCIKCAHLTVALLSVHGFLTLIH